MKHLILRNKNAVSMTLSMSEKSSTFHLERNIRISKNDLKIAYVILIIARVKMANPSQPIRFRQLARSDCVDSPAEMQNTSVTFKSLNCGRYSFSWAGILVAMWIDSGLRRRRLAAVKTARCFWSSQDPRNFVSKITDTYSCP